MPDPVSSVEAARKRPGMYVGDTDSGAGVLNMLLELVANSYDQHFAGRCSTIQLEVAPDGTITVEDDGPGLPVHGEAGVPSFDVLLTQPSFRPTVDGHRPHVHLGRGGMGLFPVNALSERFELVSIRNGVEARTLYARGQVIEPLATTATTRPSGTTIRFRPDPLIFRYPRVPRVELAQRLEDLTFLMPRLTVRWRIAGDNLASAGIAGRVALDVPCEVAEVANHRETHETARGPIDVEVALAWRSSQWTADAKPVLNSFVNLERTRDHGSHVEGMLDGIAAFLGRGPRAHHTAGLVGAVTVILADVKFGNPTKDRLDTVEARAPVAKTTRVALVRWADTYPEAAAALKERKQRAR